MRSVSMQHLEQVVQTVLSVASPFVPVDRQEFTLRQPSAAVLGRRQFSSFLRINVRGNVAEQAFQEGAHLTDRICCFMSEITAIP